MCILSGVKMVQCLGFFFFGWVGFVAVSCSVYFGNSSFRCLLTWGVGGSREIQMLLSWCFEGLWTRWWIWLGDMMTLFSEWGRRKRRRRAMMFSLKLNKIDGYYYLGNPIFFNYSRLCFYERASFGPSLTANLLEETRDRGKGFRAKDGSESVR